MPNGTRCAGNQRSIEREIIFHAEEIGVTPVDAGKLDGKAYRVPTTGGIELSEMRLDGACGAST